MFDIYCPHCQLPHLMETKTILSTHSTSDGPVAYVRCPNGHLVVKEFRANRTRAAAEWAESYRKAS